MAYVTKRWRKRIDGQDYCFGNGKGVSDRTSYRQARKKYRDFMDRREAALEEADRGLEVTATSLGKLTPEALGHILALTKLAKPEVQFSNDISHLREDQVSRMNPAESQRLQQTYDRTIIEYAPER